MGKLTVVRVSEEDTSGGERPSGFEIPVAVSRIAPSASREATPRATRIAIFGGPADGPVYRAGERIRVAVYFGAPIEVVGSPQLALKLGDHTRQAVGRASVSSRCGGFVLVSFSYIVQPDDVDTDGFSIAPDALTLNGARIRSLTGVNGELDLGIHLTSNVVGHRVNGAPPSPVVDRVLIASSPHDGNTYGAGQWIRVLLFFDRPNEVEGTPQLALTVGSETRQVSRYSRGSTLIAFRYLVQAEDMDTDGFGFTPNALTLNGGSIRSREGGEAILDLGTHAIANAEGHAVDGSRAATIKVTDAGIASFPDDRVAYRLGEWILASVSFSGPVEVVGSPQLGLIVGDQTREASYDMSFSDTLFFRYTVQAGDMDDDGIALAPNAVTLNGGSIRSPAGGEVELDLTGHTFFRPEAHKVQGGG